MSRFWNAYRRCNSGFFHTLRAKSTWWTILARQCLILHTNTRQSDEKLNSQQASTIYRGCSSMLDHCWVFILNNHAESSDQHLPPLGAFVYLPSMRGSKPRRTRVTWGAAHACTGAPHSLKSRVCGASNRLRWTWRVFLLSIYYYSVAVCKANGWGSNFVP